MTKPLAFRTAWVSDVGRVRELNEDSVLTKPEIGLWAVADGMGGYRGGDVASRAVVEALKALAPTASAALFLDAFEQKVVRVNSDLRALALARASEVVGTTLVALLVHSEHFACVWCGDSRAYLRRGGAVSQISRDHSEVQELIDQGLLDEEKAKTWPRRNVVTRALGATDKPELDLVDGRIYSGDRFLLCSDGLTTHVAQDEIAAMLSTANPQSAVDHLLALTLDRGATDNISIVVVDCEHLTAE
jgi:serine/threonine protein phosphatase PrpC